MFKIVSSVQEGEQIHSSPFKNPFVLGHTKVVKSSEQCHRILQAGTSRGARDLVAERNVGITEKQEFISIQTDTQRKTKDEFSSDFLFDCGA